MAETRHELSNYRDIIEISERIKPPEVKEKSEDRIPESHVSRKIGNYTKTHTGALPEKDCKVSSSTKTMDIKEIECFKCHKKEHYANNCPMQRRRIR